MIYLSFGSLLFVIIILGFVITQLLKKNSKLTDKLMSKDFVQYSSVKRLDERTKPAPKEEGKPKILTDIQTPEFRDDLILGRIDAR